MWKKLMQQDGGFNSNYGQYLFKPYHTPAGEVSSQFDFCVNELIRRTTSRRACMTLLNTTHMYPDNTDMVCTYAIQFFIRNHQLDMHVYMRSNDVVFGLTNDAFCFNMIQRMMVAALNLAGEFVSVGSYVHNAGTLHVYKRHYELVEQALWQAGQYTEINPPMMDAFDLEALRYDQTAVGGPFMKWVRDVL
jgi:thymidylate synthase